eukprot:scaffold92594_cov65-Phaeocystis_antarctica.AAC.1
MLAGATRRACTRLPRGSPTRRAGGPGRGRGAAAQEVVAELRGAGDALAVADLVDDVERGELL